MNEMTRLYREGMAELRAENEQLKQRIAELEAYIDELENPQSIPDTCTCEDNPQDDRAGLYIDPDCPIHGEVNNV